MTRLLVSTNLILFLFAACGLAQDTKMLVYIGTSTSDQSKGIYFTHFDSQTGQFDPPQLAAEVQRATYVLVHPNKKFLYAVDQTTDCAGNPAGVVDAFSIDASTGKLTLLNTQSSAGVGPTHIALDATNTTLFVANYGSGSVAAVPVGPDGKFTGPPTAAIQLTGTGPDPKRQTHPYAHSVNPDPTNRFMIACDLGTDRVLIYKFNAKNRTLSANDPPFSMVPSGAGARHLAYAPNGKFVYVVNEMGASLSQFSWNSDRGVLLPVETVSTVPDDFTGQKWAAEVRIHPNGKWLYASNRTMDTIALFDIDQTTGKLHRRSFTSTQGKTPRFIGFDPSFKFLIAANQDSNSIVVFRIDQATGDLSAIGNTIQVGAPTCVQFIN